VKTGVIALVAARLKSSRLPRKALLDLSGKPVVLRLFERLEQVKNIDDAILCTSTVEQDDVLAETVSNAGLPVHRGHPLDVLGRFLGAIDGRECSAVIRVTGDNPLTDPEMMDRMIDQHQSSGADYSFTEELPRGTRCEVISVEALRRCHELAVDPNSSEYMTYMLKRPDHFRVAPVSAYSSAVQRPELRLTIDTPEDYQVVSSVFSAFGGTPPGLSSIIEWLDTNPEIKAINRDITPIETDGSIDVRLSGDS